LETEIERLVVRLVGDSSDYQEMLKRAVDRTLGAADQIENYANKVNTFGFGMKRFALQAMGALTPLLGVFSLVGGAFKGVQLAAQMESMEIAFEVLTGNAELAQKTLKDLARFAAETPFEMPEIVAASKQMIAFGQDAESIVPTMRMLGDVSAGLQIPLGSLIYLYGTLKSQGRAMTVDINQFAMRGIPIWKQLEKQLDKTNTEVRDMVQDGLIGFAEIEKAFQAMSGPGGQFFGLMDKQSRSLSGLFSTMTDDVNTFLRAVGKDLAELLHLKDAMQAVSTASKSAMEGFQALPESLKAVVSVASIAVAGITGLSLAWSILGGVLVSTGNTIRGVILTIATMRVLDQFSASTSMAQAALMSFQGALNNSVVRFGLWVAAAAAVAYAGFKIGEALSGARSKNDAFNRSLEEGARLTQGHVERIQAETGRLLEKLGPTQLGTEERRTALEEARKQAAKEVEQYKSVVNAAQNEIKRLQGTDLFSRDFLKLPAADKLDLYGQKISNVFGSKEVELANTSLREANQILEARRARVKALTDEQAKLKPSEEARQIEKAVKDLEASLDQQLATWGATGNMLKIIELESQAAAGALDNARQKLEMIEQRGEAESFQKSVDDLTTSLEDQALTYGMAAHWAQIYRKELEGTWEDTKKLAEAREWAKVLDNLETQKHLQQEGMRVWKETRRPIEEFDGELQYLNYLLEEGAIDQELYDRKLQQLQENYDKTQESVKGVKTEVGNFDAALFGSADAMERIRKFLEPEDRRGPKLTDRKPGDAEIEKRIRDAGGRPEIKQDHMIDLLRGIKDIAQKQLDRPQIEVEEAALVA